MFVSCGCEGSGFCDELIPSSGESYRMCVCVCAHVSNCVSSRNFNNEEVWTLVGPLRHGGVGNHCYFI